MSTFDYGGDGTDDGNRPFDAEDSRIGWARKRKRLPKGASLGRRESRAHMSFRELAALSSSESEKEDKNESDDEHDSDNDNNSGPSPSRHKRQSKGHKHNLHKTQKTNHTARNKATSSQGKLSSPQRKKALDKLAGVARSRRGDKRDKILSSRYAYEADTDQADNAEVTEIPPFASSSSSSSSSASTARSKKKVSRRSPVSESIERDIRADEKDTRDNDVVEIDQFQDEVEQQERSEEEDKVVESEAHEPTEEEAIGEDEPEEDTGDVTQPEVVTSLDPYFDQNEFLQTLKSMRRCTVHECLKNFRIRDNAKSHSFFWVCDKCEKWQKLSSFYSDRDPASKYVLYCFCGKQVPGQALVSHSPNNPNRLYYRCDKCNFFLWKDCIGDLYTHYYTPLLTPVNVLKVHPSKRRLPRTKD